MALAPVRCMAAMVRPRALIVRSLVYVNGLMVKSRVVGTDAARSRVAVSVLTPAFSEIRAGVRARATRGGGSLSCTTTSWVLVLLWYVASVLLVVNVTVVRVVPSRMVSSTCRRTNLWAVRQVEVVKVRVVGVRVNSVLSTPLAATVTVAAGAVIRRAVNDCSYCRFNAFVDRRRGAPSRRAIGSEERTRSFGICP